MYSAIQRQKVLMVAKDAIQHGLEFCEALSINPLKFPAILQEKKATFVTLNLDGNLRGCMGNLLAQESIVESVARNTFNAAFNDPRFEGLEYDEAKNLSIHISILSKSEAIHIETEQQLQQQLTPHVDGLIIKEGNRSGTFLPEVWHKIPEPEDFIRQLKRKAGLPENYWSKSLVFERYTVDSIGLSK